MIPLPIHYEELEAIYAAALSGGQHTVAVTSADHGEGVSIIAYALARRAAAAGRRTLLVDLNTETSTVAARLGLQGEDWSPIDRTAEDSIMHMEGVCLSVLSAPKAPANILNARDDEKLKAVLAKWREQFECIILDTSPLTRLNQNNILPDMAASACDGAVFVVLAGRTPETKVSEAVARLRSAGANIVGAVINDRHNPGLIDELCRETRRLDRIAFRLMEACRRFFRTNAFLMQKI